MSLFLTGTGTGVGKTFVAIELLYWLRAHGIRAAGMKPICCGDREDARRLLAASAEGISIEELNPVWLQSPVAPSVAAQIEQVEIDLGKIQNCFRNLSERFDTVIVEGVGGWLVPMTADLFVGDFAKQLDLPVAIVAENRLGCLNHILLTLESVQRRGLVCAGVILKSANGPTDLAQSTNETELRRLLASVNLVVIDERTEPNWAEIFAKTEQPDVFRKLTQTLIS
ncbi:MAG: dethiobiotin synthase [Verrucomicrobia bacterium]|nr:MAG: dethiobiotin synthase [Verrucomicrobiota bacterium]TMP94769.1 MAG: dethiobiotin synthase [Verrucomicrobiota bacterium]